MRFWGQSVFVGENCHVELGKGKTAVFCMVENLEGEASLGGITENGRASSLLYGLVFLENSRKLVLLLFYDSLSVVYYCL